MKTIDIKWPCSLLRYVTLIAVRFYLLTYVHPSPSHHQACTRVLSVYRFVRYFDIKTLMDEHRYFLPGTIVKIASQ